MHEAAHTDQLLARYILPSAGTMVGLCTTMIGLVKLGEARIGPSRVDEFAGLIAVVFLLSATTAYLAIRFRHCRRLSHKFEQVADIAFLFGLASLTVVSLLFGYEIV